ncbi:helicase [Synechococcus phage S-SZBM1]|uniref:Helicase n=1 Tax=Synechococcus phage S-SZBM1 TaxID=2926475 RepID=A0AC61TSU0_9CAUD|nr:helicase [Synechococcus phage S-SZBM1]UNH61289.1 helicase [Synechococcus phage S-SZBM1]
MTVITKKNEVYIKVTAEPHVHQELSDHFQFDVPGAKYMPQYHKFKWDGKIRLYSPATGEIYAGLFDYVTEFLTEKGYDYQVEESKFYGSPSDTEPLISPEAVAGFIRSLGLPFKARDYQMRAVYQALKYNRRLLLSPTGSGKSLIIYALLRWHLGLDRNILIIVPTTSLVEQLYKDFQDYGWAAQHYVHKIMGGREKYSDAPVVISTWQSIYKEPRAFFKRFDVIIGDEAHLYKAKSLSGILTKCHDAKYRIGLTGTLDGMQTHQLVLEGLFGRCEKVTKTVELMKQGHLTPLKVNILLLKHGYVPFDDYQQEMDYIVTHPKRNNLITNLACDLKGNTLILFNYIEKHGDPLWELLNNKIKGDRKIFFIHGGIDAMEREEARSICEREKNAIILASYGTFSTGINIKNLHNVIFASPSKSRVRNLQSIGRVLRKGDNKAQAVLYDIADHCARGSRSNYTLRHLAERIKIYEEEKFNYEIKEIKLKHD